MVEHAEGTVIRAEKKRASTAGCRAKTEKSLFWSKCENNIELLDECKWVLAGGRKRGCVDNSGLVAGGREEFGIKERRDHVGR